MNFNCPEPVSGFAELTFYLLEEVSNFPIILTDQNSSQLVFNSFENFIEGSVDVDSIVVNVDPKISSAGTIYPIDVSFKYITRSEAAEQLLEQYANRPGIILGKLNNEFRKIYGTNEEPLYLNYRVDEGTTLEGGSNLLVRIQGETRQRPVFYTVL